MADNEFQSQADFERRRVQAEQVQAILELVKKQADELKAVRKELRLVREDLRNLDKLRPLRSKEEEKAGEQAEANSDQQ